MLRANMLRLALGVVVLLVQGPAARADPIGWSYTTFVFPFMVVPSSPGTPPPVTVYPIPPIYVTPGVNFGTTSGALAGSSRIILANLSTSSFAGASSPDVYKHEAFNL